MHGNFTRHNSIIRLVALALLALCIFQPPVRAHPTVINAGAAQSSGTHVLYQDFIIPIGLAPGQKLRYTWANLNDPDPLKREFYPLRILVSNVWSSFWVGRQVIECGAVGARAQSK